MIIQAEVFSALNIAQFFKKDVLSIIQSDKQEPQVSVKEVVEEPAVNSDPVLFVAIEKPQELECVDVDFKELIEKPQEPIGKIDTVQKQQVSTPKVVDTKPQEETSLESVKESIKKKIEQNTKNPVQVTEDEKIEMKLKNFKHAAEHAGVVASNFSLLKNGLYTAVLESANGACMPITLDLDGKTFGEEDKWFATEFHVGFELEFAPLIPTAECIAAVMNGASQLELASMWVYSPQVFDMNRYIDLASLNRIKDTKVKSDILARVYKKFQEPEFTNYIEELSGETIVRFSFASIKNSNKYKLICSSQNTLCVAGPNCTMGDEKIVIRFTPDSTLVSKKK